MTALSSFEPVVKAAGVWSELKELLHVSLSLAVVQVGFHLPGVVDTALAGRVGGETLAATGLGAAIFFTVSVFGIGVVMGIEPLAAQAFGAGRSRQGRRLMWQGIYAAGMVTVPLGGIMLWAGSNLHRFGVSESLSALTAEYVWGRVASLWPLLSCVAIRSYLQSAHHTRPIVVAVVALNVFNLVADWLFLFGDPGLVALGLPAIGVPALGVLGLAWASTVATVGQLVVLALATRRVEPGTGDEPVRALDRAALSRVFNLGVPLGLQLGAEVGVFALVGVMMGGMGTLAAAAHQVVLQLSSLTFAASLGIGAATAVQVGRAIGRGDGAATRRAGLYGILSAATFMLCMAAIMWLWPRALVRVMTSDLEVMPGAMRLLLIAAAFQVVDGMQAVGSGALRGAGATRFAFGAHLVGHWLVGLPLGVGLAFGAGMGPAGLWWGLTAGLAVVALTLTIKFSLITRGRVAPLE